MFAQALMISRVMLGGLQIDIVLQIRGELLLKRFVNPPYAMI